ncbi:rCG21473 [Rattus norvegicus]|uniref:RCG21473 n=1 Tax=Rattus norvegicus TaxID=10116 RepID=A6J1X3_RAT|nr:rCG21473 [Rattus norvegicus]
MGVTQLVECYVYTMSWGGGRPLIPAKAGIPL